MANHSWVFLKEPLTVEQAEEHIVAAVERRLGGRLTVERRPDWEENDRLQKAMWRVYVPGSALEDREAAKRMLAPNQDYSFSVWLSRSRDKLEFRHPINHWEHWAQDVIREDLCQVVGTVWGSDHDDELAKGNPDALKTSYRAFICRNFPDPLPEEDREWIEGLMEYVPEGFRD